MKPSDLRNATWAEVQQHLGEDMLRVHAAWLAHGPGTTREIAEKSGISLLTFRPRTTDLYQLGYVACIGSSSAGNEGIYRGRTDAEAEQAWNEGKRPDDPVRGTPPVVNTLPLKEQLLAQIRRLPIDQQLSIAGAIRASAQHQPRHVPNPSQSELTLA